MKDGRGANAKRNETINSTRRRTTNITQIGGSAQKATSTIGSKLRTCPRTT